jgi:hypothetical protein
MIWVIPSIVIVLIIIFLSRIHIEWHYLYRQKVHLIQMKISMYHVRLYKYEIKLPDKSADNPLDDLGVDKFIEKMKELIHVIQLLRSFVYFLLRKMNIHLLHWTTHVGAGDAAATGMVSGALWSVKGVLGGFIIENGRLCAQPNISIVPHYEQSCLYSQMDCMVSIRIGQAIHAFLKLMMLFSNKKKVYI